MPTLNYTWHDDGETFTAELDQETLITADHGEYGWAGMEAVKTALDKVAAAAGWEIRHYGEPCI